MSLWIAALADSYRRGQVDFPKEFLCYPASLLSLVPCGRDCGNDGNVAVASEVRGDFRKPADILVAILRREAKIAIEAGPQRVAVEQHGNASAIKQSSFQSTSKGRLSGCGQARQ